MTDRQKEILKAIIDEFMSDPTAVGSMNIVTKYELGVSPATVRNEMVELAEDGYLSKSHSSSGRIPTDLGFRFFVQEIMEEDPINTMDEVKIRMSIFDRRFEEESLMREVLKYLSASTNCAAISILGDVLRSSGISTLTNFQELRNVDILDTILYLLENSTSFKKMLEKCKSDDICVLIGNETGMANFDRCALVFSGFNYVGDKRGYIGVLGPRRMNYAKAIPAVRVVRNYLEQAVRGW